MASYVLESWKKKFGGQMPDYIIKKVPLDPSNPGRKMNFVKVFLYWQYQMLYNYLDDIYVNRLVGVHSAPFAPGGSKAEQVKILYRDYLFPSRFEEIIDPATGQKVKKPLIGQASKEGEKYKKYKGYKGYKEYQKEHQLKRGIIIEHIENLEKISGKKIIDADYIHSQPDGTLAGRVMLEDEIWIHFFWDGEKIKTYP